MSSFLALVICIPRNLTLNICVCIALNTVESCSMTKAPRHYGNINIVRNIFLQ